MNNEVNDKNNFKYTKTSYSARYYSFLWTVILYTSIIVSNKGTEVLPAFFYDAFFKDWAISLVFLLPIFCWQIWSIIATRNSIKFLEVKDELLFIRFFGILKEKHLQINYSDISSLEWSKDPYKHFVFNFKNREKRLIRAEIYDKEIAFDMIQKKISEANS